ncbi:uncharacterized protein N7446_010539 [Penicillium canescens]|uniref:Uncharacterized protein n=1 Tax=Penicillium canescens TaxID=5083 RepID=A0AAD6N8I2_PENCN|nr:uncharacterized protein N7446_010539 [Penicillium canescens]KAJ6041578.1 hypothetical protein N7460_006968 [Penicillium canescens]KAJ6050430.1 hypothetical protein N7446_010539 [Penicillium canescens]KAJ6064733.1 hypothetical protein N7444_000386 [Penicillium canescens]
MFRCIGSGLSIVHTALETFVENPSRLDFDRSRFGRRAPSHTSCQSHNSTRSQSPCGTSEMEQRRDRRQWQLAKDHEASRPDRQFDAQVDELEARIIDGIENRKVAVPDGTNMHNLARDTVKKNWIKQGIWNEQWKNMPKTRWMHEESRDMSSASETDTSTALKLNLFSPLEKAESWSSQPYSGSIIQQRVERRARQKNKNEASRPFHQFIYQISEEREQLQSGSPDDTVLVSAPLDINTNAYNNVKRTWVKRGIWNEKWGILPGMLWKHEGPLQPDTDLGLSQTKITENGTSNLNTVPSVFDGCVPLETYGHFSEGGRRARKRNRAAANSDDKESSIRKVSRTGGLDTSSSRIEKRNSSSRLDTNDQGTQGTGTRRSRRLQKQAASFNGPELV